MQGMNAWVVVYAIGAAQAALLALALWRRPANVRAKHVLAAWIALVGLDLAVKAVFLSAPSTSWFPVYRFVGLFPFLYGALFYLYVRALTTGRGFAARDLLHLAGFVVALALELPLLAAGAERQAADLALWMRHALPPSLPHHNLLLFCYSLSYVAAALLRLHRYRRALRQRRSDADRLSLRWVEMLALAQVAIWCIALLHVLMWLPGVDYYLIYGAVAAWVCAVGWFSLSQPPMAEALAPEADASGDAGDVVASGNDDPRFPEVEARLRELMAAQALYREPALTIGQLARRSGYPEYLVSAVINRRFDASFCDWINGQRVEAARARLADPGEARTILDIAYDCGFTSKSTFNAAFKRIVGQTPSAYRRSAGREAA